MTTSDPVQRKVKHLSVAVWILSILLCIALFISFVLVRGLSVAGSGFDRLSPEERVQSASVIALAKWRKTGSNLSCVISEILKQTPNTQFYYKVGDEFRAGNQHAAANTDFGDGVVLFFSGSPAHLEETVAYRNDRITGMGDMPITTFREIIRASK